VVGHTGLFRTACEDMLVRDAPTVPCSSGDAIDASWLLFISLNIGIASKAMWGLVITYRATQNAVSTSSLDAILARLFAHSAVTQSVRISFNVSHITVASKTLAATAQLYKVSFEHPAHLHFRSAAAASGG